MQSLVSLPRKSCVAISADEVHECFLWQGYATFNDDIQATAAVTLGALMGAQRLPGVPPLRQQAFLFFGAGQANLGAAQLLVRALAEEGVPEEDAKRQIWLMDSQVRATDRHTQCSACRALRTAQV